MGGGIELAAYLLAFIILGGLVLRNISRAGLHIYFFKVGTKASFGNLSGNQVAF